MRPTRLAADGLALALGVNLWLSLSLVPGLQAGAFARHPGLALAAPAPLLLLLVGAVRRSPVWLLGAYPAALLLPVAVEPRIAASIGSGPLALVLTSASLIGFLFGSSYLTMLGATGEPALGPVKTRRLTGSLGAQAPARWQRRQRIYLGMAVLSAIFPALLLYKIGLDGETRAYLLESYPDELQPGDRAAAMLTVLLFGALAIWLLVFSAVFVGPLRHHRTGDRELHAELDRLRRDARQPAPRVGFYVGVLVALVLMALLIGMRVGAP